MNQLLGACSTQKLFEIHNICPVIICWNKNYSILKNNRFVPDLLLLLFSISGMTSDETECLDSIQRLSVSELGVEGADAKSYRISGTDFRSLFRRPVVRVAVGQLVPVMSVFPGKKNLVTFVVGIQPWWLSGLRRYLKFK